MIVKELVGEVNKELVTLETLKVKLVPAFTTCANVILIELDETRVHTELMATFVNEHVEDVRFN